MSFAAPPPDATRREEPLAGHTRHEQHPPAPDWSEQTRPEALPPEQQTAGHTRREELPDQDLSGRTRREELPSEALDGRTRREELPGEAADGRTRREELPDQYLDGRTRREGPEAGGGRPGPLAADGAGRHTRRLVLPEPLAERYEYIGDLAAGGAEADLALLRDKTTGRELVMKLYRAAHAGVDMKALEALSRADREHVVELVEIREWQGLTWELQEFFPLGTLEDLRRKHGPKLNEAQVEVIVEQLASAIEHVHSLGIAHRDLKPANVLVRSEQPRLDLALADFGLSVAQALSFDVRSVAGTWGWAAPEVHHGIAGRAGDWWALGAIVYEMTVGRTLFTRADGTVLPEAQIRALVGEGKYSTEAVESDRLRLLVDGLLTYNREQRWGAAQVNEWLAGGSPAVVRSAPAVGLPLLGTVVHDPRDLAAALRERWQEAGDLMASRPDQALRAWLVQTPQGRDALAVIEFGGSPGAKLVRLQGVLDPSVAAEFRGVPLTADNFAEHISAVRSADGSPDQAAAAEWLDAVRRERILGAWAAVSGSAESAAADYHLAQWFERAKEVAANWPAPIRESLFRVQSPITANALAAALTGSTE
ncbi:MAG: protein kinase, partial [Bifidobacteriaceae bacterium]|nr:protein kinase [Bifidobacteriaceae bacterium]